ncbi:hypothetical protein ACFV24_02440 [Nocardia fluminea]|uniref:hypothetical protein n=1 Tax=Nocardia fluminea TaxID=134984 RepID=UPI00366F1155
MGTHVTWEYARVSWLSKRISSWNDCGFRLSGGPVAHLYSRRLLGRRVGAREHDTPFVAVINRFDDTTHFDFAEVREVLGLDG